MSPHGIQNYGTIIFFAVSLCVIISCSVSSHMIKSYFRWFGPERTSIEQTFSWIDSSPSPGLLQSEYHSPLCFRKETAALATSVATHVRGKCQVSTSWYRQEVPFFLGYGLRKIDWELCVLTLELPANSGSNASLRPIEWFVSPRGGFSVRQTPLALALTSQWRNLGMRVPRENESTKCREQVIM